jgi:hypothetical protein
MYLEVSPETKPIKASVPWELLDQQVRMGSFLFLIQQFYISAGNNHHNTIISSEIVTEIIYLVCPVWLL